MTRKTGARPAHIALSSADMGDQRLAGVAGVVAGVAAVPVMHFVAVDFEQGGTPDVFLAHVRDQHVRIGLFAGLGLVLGVVLLVHVLALRRTLHGVKPAVTEAGTALAGIAALGFFLSSAAAWIGGYGASEGLDYEAIRPMGLVAENLMPVLSAGFAGTALMVAWAALRERRLPRWLGWVGAVFLVLLTGLGVVLPAAASLPAVVWVLVSGVGLVVAPEHGAAVTAADPRRVLRSDHAQG